MGYYKNTRDARSAARRYNAAKRKQNSLSGAGASSLIRLETISETERYSMAQDADRVVEYNNAINAWQNSVAAQLRATIAVLQRAIPIASLPESAGATVSVPVAALEFVLVWNLVPYLFFSFTRRKDNANETE